MHSSARGAVALMVLRRRSSAACLSGATAARYSAMLAGLLPGFRFMTHVSSMRGRFRVRSFAGAAGPIPLAPGYGLVTRPASTKSSASTSPLAVWTQTTTVDRCEPRERHRILANTLDPRRYVIRYSPVPACQETLSSRISAAPLRVVPPRTPLAKPRNVSSRLLAIFDTSMWPGAGGPARRRIQATISGRFARVASSRLWSSGEGPNPGPGLGTENPRLACRIESDPTLRSPRSASVRSEEQP